MSGKKEWPLDLFRRRSRGWEKHIPAASRDDDDHILQPNAMGKPMAGCVYIKRYRLKINLNDGKAGLMEVVRRNKCMLFTPKSNRHAQILLQFHSLKDCLEFSDELMLLNQSLYTTATEVSSSMSTVNDKNCPNKSSTAATNPTAASQKIALDGSQTSNPVTQAGMQRNEIYSQIVQLVHDEGFLAFTAKVENLIKSSPDGEMILQALQGSGN